MAGLAAQSPYNPQNMTLNPGTRVGPYEIVGSLGTGGMGEVYRARDPRLARDVALKVLPTGMAADPARHERFTREARAIAALNHPHIVTIYSTEDADGIRFLTMELIEGQPLDALIPPGGLPLKRFLELALPLADALTAAHQKQITHRDLKPANVMVANDGRVKVLDFGLALAPSGGTGLSQSDMATIASPQVTTPGTIIGTMPYMSPEQVEGRPLDHRTDLFSLGVMFHEMLTGSRPFSGDTSPQLMSAILRDAPRSTSEIRADIPDALSRLIQRCLEKRPDDRVQTARDIYNELRHVQKQLESGTDRLGQQRRHCPGGRRQALDRGTAVHGSWRRSRRCRAGLGPHRGHHRGPVAVLQPLGRGAAIDAELQGLDARRAPDRRAAERALRHRRQRPEVGVRHSHHGAPGRRPRRFAALDRNLRSERC